MSDHEDERIVEPEAGVMSGDDDVLSQPAPPLDPYTPEPGPGPGEQRAFNVLRWAWIPVIFAVLLIVVALFR
ncbi:MAG: hypothetical protein H0V79_01420 [Actinobacteria bacterium]|nr:hypothetical protein [Actinomycetota bacterium]